MRVFAFIIIFELCSLLCFPQDDTVKNVKFGVNISNVMSRANGPFISINALIYLRKHAFFLGPKLRRESIGGGFLNKPDFIRFIKRIGILGGYQFYPNLKKKQFNLYFENIVQFYTYRNVNTVTGDATDPKVVYPYVGVEYRYAVFESTIGYGIRLKIYKGLHINTNAGYGIVIAWIKALSHDYKFIKIEDNISLKFGIGYDF